MSVSYQDVAISGHDVIVDDSSVDGGESKSDDKDDGGGGGGGGVGVSVAHEDDQRREMGCGCTPRRNLAKVKKAFGSSSNKKPLRKRRRRNGKGCVFCFSRPKTVGSPAESLVSDPDDPAFTHEMLRELLERNDFYSGECNPHLSIHYASCEHR
ncbi:hypothetical protein BT93_H1068 [Corymbia citriodora subsp. variegata]|nr:hypothetical protein BT93_H1068 [Corymbia citriodora subsp. variegata]